MSIDVSGIQDPVLRHYCMVLERHMDQWRKVTKRIAELRHELTTLSQSYPFPDDGINFGFRDLLVGTMSLETASSNRRNRDASVRIRGFDARRRGEPVYANPHTILYTCLDDESLQVDIIDGNALPWYVGWKQAARVGESMLPE